MTRETQWRDEWAVLRAERDLARRRWRSAADELAVRVRDPLRLGKLVHEHPVVAGGIGAGLAALLVKMFMRRGRASHDDASNGAAQARPASAWTTMLRDAALSVAVPWLVRMLKDKFGWDFDGAAPSTNPPRPTPAETDAPATRV